ncbi:MAG: nuclear transport factor 2 family protein [Candidatus Neomarinimicrobiota bacterium]
MTAGCSEKINLEAETAVITEVVRDGIGWAMTKDLDRLYSIMAQDENLHIINPDDSEVNGFKAFSEMAESFWMDDRFKATGFDVRNLRITFSQSGTVAWYACRLDDLYEWDGRAGAWKDVRWSGIVEKRDGRWVHTQMHFSFPK